MASAPTYPSCCAGCATAKPGVANHSARRAIPRHLEFAKGIHETRLVALLA